jgi:hypothetical protein
MVETVVSINSKVTAQILFDGAQEILGMETMQKVIQRLSPGEPSTFIGSPENPALAQAVPFLRELEVIYGEPGGRGLALRIGRAVFRHGLKRFGEKAGFRAVEFRLLPAPRRLENGLHILAQLIGKECDRDIAVSDEGAHWLWHMNQRSNDAGPQKGVACFLIAGLLQEFTAWAGGGRFYRVIETECRASGSPACIYRIEKKPLD